MDFGRTQRQKERKERGGDANLIRLFECRKYYF